jgi:hypothetical protein
MRPPTNNKGNNKITELRTEGKDQPNWFNNTLLDLSMLTCVSQYNIMADDAVKLKCKDFVHILGLT